MVIVPLVFSKFWPKSFAPTFGKVFRDVGVDKMFRRNMSIDQAREFVDLEKTQEKNPVDIYLSLDDGDNSRLRANIYPPKDCDVDLQRARQNRYFRFQDVGQRP